MFGNIPIYSACITKKKKKTNKTLNSGKIFNKCLYIKDGIKKCMLGVNKIYLMRYYFHLDLHLCNVSFSALMDFETKYQNILNIQPDS